MVRWMEECWAVLSSIGGIRDGGMNGGVRMVGTASYRGMMGDD